MNNNEFTINFFDNTNIKEIIYDDFDIVKKKITLKDKNIKNGIIICYSSLCMSCKKYYNIILNLSELYDSKLSFFAINCNNIKDKNDELIQPLNITEYPILKIIKNKKIIHDNININSLENLMFIVNTYF